MTRRRHIATKAEQDAGRAPVTERPKRESALSPEDTSNDVPVQPSTLINMQRQSRRIE